MTPVIRVDDEVMEKLMEKAIDFHLVFPTPNEVIRKILSLDIESSTEQADDEIKIQLPTIHTPRRFALIPIPKDQPPDNTASLLDESERISLSASFQASGRNKRNAIFLTYPHFQTPLWSSHKRFFQAFGRASPK